MQQYGRVIPVISEIMRLLCSLFYLKYYSVFFESVTWDEWTVGFHTVPSGSGNEHRSILSYHFYSPPDVSLLFVNIRQGVLQYFLIID